MNEKLRVLTGITTTGIPHLGNYAGAIRPAIEASRNPNIESFLFLADYHALIKCREPKVIQESARSIAATWLAFGLDPKDVTFYRQSDVPEITELKWILSTITAKGLLNRAHAYKATVQENISDNSSDPDRGIDMGLFEYPVLMAADILLFNGQQIPVGKDQIQHIEMARDIAKRFNYIYGDTFSLPEALITEDALILPGLDGRKMSKSYGNTIPLFESEKKLKKLINKIKTNSLEPGEPKDADGCSLFAIFTAFATKKEQAALKKQYEEGIAWGDVKKILFEYLNDELKDNRTEYEKFLSDPAELNKILTLGALKAKETAVPFLTEIRQKIGIGSLC